MYTKLIGLSCALESDLSLPPYSIRRRICAVNDEELKRIVLIMKKDLEDYIKALMNMHYPNVEYKCVDWHLHDVELSFNLDYYKVVNYEKPKKINFFKKVEKMFDLLWQ